jgi:hypothetical protein
MDPTDDRFALPGDIPSNTNGLTEELWTTARYFNRHEPPWSPLRPRDFDGSSNNTTSRQDPTTTDDCDDDFVSAPSYIHRTAYYTATMGANDYESGIAKKRLQE